MECVLTGNQIKCLSRALACFAKIGYELLTQALPDKLIFRTLNSSRSAFLSITFKAQFFDAYHVSEGQAQCSVLLKVVRKTYWICCNSDEDMQDVTVNKNLMPSHLVVKPRDLTRLLGHFQSSLQEITFIATEPLSTPTDSETPEAKAVEMRSYIDPAKDSTDCALHTQLWIDPTEELQEYSHTGFAVDVTICVKELSSVLLAPNFGLDDTVHADFDATLVLATCHDSQIRGAEGSEQQTSSRHSVERNARTGQNSAQNSAQRNSVSRGSTPGSGRESDRTVIWSELSASENQVRAASTESPQLANSLDASEEIPFRLHRQNNNRASTNSTPTARALSRETSNRTPMQAQCGPNQQNTPVQCHTIPVQQGNSAYGTPTALIPPAAPPAEVQPMTQDDVSNLAKNLSNWVSGDIDNDDEDDTANEDYCVESTPTHRRGLY